jgi:hypothetical protein
MAKTSSDLRETLFATIEQLRNGEIDVATAKTVGELSQVVINSAKAELDYLKLVNGPGAASKFLDVVEPEDQPGTSGTRRLT